MNSIYQNKIVKNILVLLFWILLWYILALLVDQELILPGPVVVSKALMKLIATKDFWLNCLTSIYRIVLGYVMGIIVALILVFISCYADFIKSLISPLIKIIRSSPVASFIILALLWMGKSRVVSLIAMMMVIPIVYENVMNAYYNTDNLLLEMAKAYRFDLYKTIRYIYLPSIKPALLAACLSAMGLAWKSGVASEVLSLPKNAIGSQLYYSKIYLETSNLFAWTIVVIVLSSIIEKLIEMIIKGAKHED